MIFVRARRFINLLPIGVKFFNWFFKIEKFSFSKYILPRFLSLNLGLINNGAMGL